MSLLSCFICVDNELYFCIMGVRGRGSGGRRIGEAGKGKWRKEGKRGGGSWFGKHRVGDVEKVGEEWSEAACGGVKENSNKQHNREKGKLKKTNKFRQRHYIGGHQLRLTVTAVLPVLLLFIPLHVSLVGGTTSPLEHRRTTPTSSYVETTRPDRWKAATPTLMKHLGGDDVAVANGGYEDDGVKVEFTATRRLADNEITCVFGDGEANGHFVGYGPKEKLPKTDGTVKLVTYLDTENGGTHSWTVIIDNGTWIGTLSSCSGDSIHVNSLTVISTNFEKGKIVNFSIEYHRENKSVSDEDKSWLRIFFKAVLTHVSVLVDDDQTALIEYFIEQRKLMDQTTVQYQDVLVRHDTWIPDVNGFVRRNVSLVSKEDLKDNTWEDKAESGVSGVFDVARDVNGVRYRAVSVYVDGDKVALSYFTNTTKTEAKPEKPFDGTAQQVVAYVSNDKPDAALLVGHAIEREKVCQQFRLKETSPDRHEIATQLALGMIAKLAGKRAGGGADLLIEDPNVFERIKQEIDDGKTLERKQLILSRANMETVSNIHSALFKNLTEELTGQNTDAADVSDPIP
eukprot:GHVS01067172.1.p1 GENE.GHVS01067172.1~~GHVS01067172.1.p1  ORF type:complete len:569 (-),score=60.48 GHVS01067172.1:668-2374(-)